MGEKNGSFTIKRVYGFVFFVVFLLTIGYTFAVTFFVSPLEKRVDKMEKKVIFNEKSLNEIHIHIEYIRDDLATIKSDVKKLGNNLK